MISQDSPTESLPLIDPSGMVESSSAMIVLSGMAEQSVPLLVSLPHSGRVYPPEFLAQSRLSLAQLRTMEDFQVDLIFASAKQYGAAVLQTHYARAWLDVNRRLSDLDPRLVREALEPSHPAPSLMVKNGIGLIPRLVKGGLPIYRQKLDIAEVEQRIARGYQPYHQQLAAAIEQTQQRFGRCIVLDAHSMPSHHQGSEITADLVLGNCYGRACSPELSAAVAASLTERGYSIAFNQPYAGGYITQSYSNPSAGIEVLQIEINRRLYMDESRLERLPNFARLQADLDSTLANLGENFFRIRR